MMITATHTHSGPMTYDMLCTESDPVIPKTDPRYVERLEDGIVRAAVQAFRTARPAEIGLAMADGSCVGGNRHDLAGRADPEVPVLVGARRDDQCLVAAMLVCSMHPTVLHEDSTPVSGDFPAMTRQYLQEHASLARLSRPSPYRSVRQSEPSTRHSRENTFDEAARLGHRLGQSVAGPLPRSLCRTLRSLVMPGDGSICREDLSRGRTEPRHNSRPPRSDSKRFANPLQIPRDVRTAECDWFGAEECLALARAAVTGRAGESLP